MLVPLIHLRRIDSTQDFLIRHPELGLCGVLADCQLAGRGQRGNTWESAPGAGLWLSARLQAPALATGLMLQRAMGAVAEALEPWGVDLGLKWPNDLVAWKGDRLVKLGGIIGQIRGGRVLLGVGVNLHSAPVIPGRWAQPGCLAEFCPGKPLPETETLALEILSAWEDLTIQYEPAFRWPEAGRAIRWSEGQGKCLGWLEDGRLSVQTEAGAEALSVGEVSGLENQN